MNMQLTTKQKRRLERALKRQKRELEDLLSADGGRGLDESMQESLAELSAYDNHPADTGTELFERGKDLSLTRRLERQLQEVNAALEKMETGRYGICAVCGEPIPYGRLEAIPWTLTCVNHAPDQALSEARPPEEEPLAPPFGRGWLDESGEQAGTDAEEIWQTVERYGSSDGPATDEDREPLADGGPYAWPDEDEGFVEAIENFLATDLYGDRRVAVQGSALRKYVEQGEGDRSLEVIDYRDAADAFDEESTDV